MKTLLCTDRTNPALNAELAEWAGRGIWGDKARGFGPCMTLAVSEDGKLAAVVVYHNYQPEAGVVELTTNSTTPRWLTRSVLHEMFALAYQGLECQLVVIRVSPSNTRMQRMLKAYGFQCYTIPRLRGRYEDELVFTLTDNCFWTNSFNKRLSNGKKIPEAA